MTEGRHGWSRARKWLGYGIASMTWLGSARAARADRPSTPQRTTFCEDLLVIDAVPARNEWAYWVSGGGLTSPHERSGASVGIGTELTWSIATHRGFPAGVAGRRTAELRMGPWFATAVRAEGGLVEGGLKLHWGAVEQSGFGTFELRLGAGVAAFSHGPAPTLDVTLLWGTRSVLARYSRRTPCDPVATAKSLAESSVLRLFLTQRNALSSERGHEIVIGIELSPSLLLPPYSWRRVLGGNAR